MPTLIHLAHLLTAAWATAGELITAASILWALNTLANAVRLTYQAGHAFGTFYRAHLHQPLKWLLVRLIALIITTAELAWLGACWTWENRNQIRESISSAFVYRYQPSSSELAWASQ